MNKKLSRNAPCQCGSGKKYKNCCMRTVKVNGREQVLTPRFQFEPGSYGGSGQFTPSIACMEQTALNVWDYAYVLAKPNQVHLLEDAARLEAEDDLNEAFMRRQQGGSDLIVGQYLSSLGYARVEGFKVIEDDEGMSFH